MSAVPETPTCELCSPADVVLENDLAYVRHDNNSLSRGHVLVIPKRHVASFFDMTREERYRGDVSDPRGGIRCVLARCAHGA